MTAILSPPITPAAQCVGALRAQGHAVLDAGGLQALAGVDAGALDALRPSWQTLPPDQYLRDGGRYRRRRHACFVAEGAALARVAHRAHWQPLEYNALHGGIERWFEPVDDAVAASAGWRQLLLGLAATASGLRGPQPWFIEAHQFRIDTAGGIGRPTPEGAHRDGVDLVAVVLVDRQGVKGGETRVFDATGPAGLRFTLLQPWSALLLDDARVIHETTPIQPASSDVGGHRDTLVVTLRAGGFQGPVAA
jgi:hypothetical protein